MKSANDNLNNRFELEALEQRVLLSADILSATATLNSAVGPAQQTHTQVVIQDSTPIQGAIHQTVNYDPANAIGSIFEGITGSSLTDSSSSQTSATPTSGTTQQATTDTQSTTTSTTSTTSTSTSTSNTGSNTASAGTTDSTTQTTSTQEISPVTQAAIYVLAQPVTLQTSGATVLDSTSSTGTVSDPLAVNLDSPNPLTQQLTTTLKVGNSPPTTETAIKTSSFSSFSQTGVSQSTTSTVASAFTTSSLSITSNTNTPSDINAIIDAELNKYIAGTDSGTKTFSYGDVVMDGVLTLHSTSVTFSGITVSNGNITAGSVTISATSANLSLGLSVTSTINTISGSYSLSTKVYKLTLGTTSVSMGLFVQVNAAGAAVTYDRTGNVSATITDGTTTSSKSVQVLTIGLNDATIFSGLNGPSTNPGAIGVRLDHAGFALAMLHATDGTNYYAFKTTAGSLVPVGLPSSINMSATDLTIEVNGSTDGNNVVDFTQFAGGKLTVPTSASTSVDLAYSHQLLEATGTITINVNGFAYIHGNIAITSGATTTATLTNGTTTSTKSGTFLTIGASDVTIFAGLNGPETNAGATGVELDHAGFALAIFKPTTTSDTTFYYGLKTTAGSLKAVGLPSGFNMSATDLSVDINSSNDGNNVIDFTQLSGGKLTVLTGPSTSVDIDFSQKFVKAAATIELNFQHYIYISGSIVFQELAAQDVTLTDGTTTSTKNVTVLTIGASNITIFAGMNGPATNSGASGVELDGANFALALFKPTNTSDSSSYYGFMSTAGTLKAVNIPGVTISSTDFAVDLNGSNDGNKVVDFSKLSGGKLTVPTGSSSSMDLNFNQKILQASGTLEINLKGFIYISGSIALQQTAPQNVTLTDGTTTSTKNMSMLTFGANNLTIFAGMNGPASHAGAMGVQLTNAGFALAIFKPTDTSDSSVYYGLKSKAGSLKAVGLPDGFTLTSTDLLVDVNGSNDGNNVVDFTQFAGGKLTVPTSSSTSVDLDFNQKFLKAAGTVELDFKGFIYISGSVAIQETAAQDVTLTDGTTTTTKNVTTLTIGASSVTIFVGMNGPASHAGATGVQLTNAGFALALFKPTDTNDSTYYYGLKSNAASLTAIGLPTGFKLTSTDLSAEINGSNDGNNVVDFTTFAGGKLTVPTGPSTSVDLDYNSKFVKAAGTIELDFGGFVYINGSMAIQESAAQSVTITDGTTTTTKTMTLLTIGANDLTIFAGMNGPSSHAGATGVELDHAGFALALFKPTDTTDSTSYYGLKSKAGTLKAVGLPDGFKLTSTDLLVDVNGSNDGNNVVNFTTFTGGKLTVATGPSTSVDLDFNQKFLKAAGTIQLSLKGFIYISGSMAIQETGAQTVTLTNGTTTSTKSMTLLTIGANDLTIFAGMNGPADQAGATGVQLSHAGFALALFKPADTTDTTTYYGLKSTAGSLKAVGLPDGFTMSATDLSVDVNGSTDGNNVVDFTTFTGGKLTVATGPATSIDLDFNQKFLKAAGTIELDFKGFVYINGSMAIQESGPQDVTITDGTTTTTKSMNTLTVGASNVTIFAGMNGPASHAGATGVQLTNAGFALAIFTPADTTDATSYYGLKSTVGSLKGVGLPDGFTMSATDLSVNINGSTDGNNVVDFTTFTGGKLTVATGPSSSMDLDFNQKLIQASGTIELDLKGFVYIHGSMAIQQSGPQDVTLTDGTNTTTKTVTMLTIGANDLTIFAGVNGPASNSGATGIQLSHAGFALALFKPTDTTDSSVYYGVKSKAGTLSAVGLPSGFTLGANALVVDINSSNDGSNVVDFTSFSGGKLTVATGPSTSVDLDFSGSFIMVAGTLSLDFTNYIHISGSFSFVKTSDEMDIVVGAAAFDGAIDATVTIGSKTTPLFSATGSLSMKITSVATTILSSSLTINGHFTINPVLDIETLHITVANISILKADGSIQGVVDPDGTVHDPIVTVSADSASFFPGNSMISATVTKNDGDLHALFGMFNLRTNAFTLTVSHFVLTIGSNVVVVTADGLVVSYDPTNTDPDQQLVQLATGSIAFHFGSMNVSGNLTGLIIRKDGLHLNSVSITVNQTLSVSSILSVTNPSVTLTDFDITFGNGGGVTFGSGSAITVSATSLSLFPGNSTFNASATGLTITVNISSDPTQFGHFTVSAQTFSITVGPVSFNATNITINPNAGNNGTVLSVGTAVATIGSLPGGASITGSATDFKVNLDSNGSPVFVRGNNFSVSFTADPGTLGIPAFLKLSITQLTLDWPADSDTPTGLTVSASVTGIAGLGTSSSPITFSGQITGLKISITKLLAGQFPITDITSFGVQVSGKMFGAQVSAALLGGVVKFNNEGGVIGSDGNVIAGQPGANDNTVAGSVLWLALEGSINLAGLGSVSIRIGVSQLGPLSVYFEAGIPLILDPESGLALTNFRGGIDFSSTITPPTSPFDLRGGRYQPPLNQSLADWTTQIQSQIVNQYRNPGGTSFANVWNQPMVIHAGATLYDAYLSTNAFTANVDITFDTTGKILLNGNITFGNSVTVKGTFYIDLSALAQGSGQITFLIDNPADTPLESFFGNLTFGFSKNGVIIHPTLNQDGTLDASQTPDGYTLQISGGVQYSALGYATINISGTVTITYREVTSGGTTHHQLQVDVTGTANVTYLGDLGTISGEFIVDFGASTNVWGALVVQPGSALAKLQQVGLTITGVATFEFNSSSSTQTVNLPDPAHPTDPTKATPISIEASTLEIVVSGALGDSTAQTGATVTYSKGGQTVFQAEGGLLIKVSSASGLQIFADISVFKVGPPAASIVNFSGHGLFVVNDQGVIADIALTIAANTFSGMTFNASFNLVMNTTSQDYVFTIPNSLPGIPDPANPGSFLRTITVPRGPPQADGTAGPAGPYVVITGNGTLSVSGLDMTGYFRFEISSGPSGPLVSLVVKMTADIQGTGTCDINGGFQFSGDGVVALLNLTVQGSSPGSPTSYGTGISFVGSFQLAINSTSSDVTSIGGVPLNQTLAAGTYKIIASGTLTVGLSGNGFVIVGYVNITVVSDTSTTIQVSGLLTATVNGTTLLTLHADGTIEIYYQNKNDTHPTAAGMIALSVQGGSPLAGSGYNLQANFTLQINTTGQNQTVPFGTPTQQNPNPTVTIAGGANHSSYIKVHADGTLAIGTTQGFNLVGTFDLTVDSSGLSIAATATLNVIVNSSTILSMTANGGMEITSNGIAASITLSFSSGNSFGGTFTFSGTFTLSLNTTSSSVTTIAGVTLTTPLAAGPYVQISVTNGSITFGNASGVSLNGGFTLTLSTQGLAVSATATLQIKVGGTTFLSLAATGAMLINSSGIAAKITLTLGGGSPLSGTGFSFSGTFVLKINTTGSTVTTINNVNVNLSSSIYVEVDVSGTLQVASIVNISGAFTLVVSASGLTVTIQATTSLLGATFSVSGSASITSTGIAMNITLMIGTSSNPVVGINGFITVSGTFNLQVNTTGTDTLGVAHGTTFKVSVSNATLYLFNIFSITGSFSIQIVNGVFRADIQHFHIGLSFLGSLDISGFFDSNGYFSFTASATLTLGSSDFNIHGSVVLEFVHTATDTHFKLHIDGGVTAFGYDFADISCDVSISGTDIYFSVSVRIMIIPAIDWGIFGTSPAVYVGGTVTIDLGSTASAPTPPVPNIAQASGGVLQLNLGTDVNLRGGAEPPSETYQITKDGSGNIVVTDPALNATKTFSGITSIVIHNTDTSDTSIQVADDVTVPITITAGSGNNQFIMGGGLATITGTTGNDFIRGGSGGVNYSGSTGTNTFIAGNANNTITNGATTTVIEQSSSYYTLSNSSIGHGTFTDSISGVKNVTLTATGTTPGGTTTFTVNSWSGFATLQGATGAQSAASTYNGNVTLLGNSTPNSVVQDNGGKLILINIATLALNGGSGNNSFTVTGWNGSGALTLDGKGGSDTYNINYQAAGTYTVNVSDSSGSGDQLNINGQAAGETITANGSSITEGSQTISYSGIEGLAIAGFAGNDTITAGGLSIPTVITGGNGTDTFNLKGLSATVTLTTGTGTNTINVGSNGASSGTLNNITALLTITGNGTDSLNLNDTTDNGANTGILGVNALSGIFGTNGSLSYFGIETFNLSMGSGGNTLTITGTSGTDTINTGTGNDTVNVQAISSAMNLNGQGGSNTINVGTNAPSNNGNLANIKGLLTVNGGGTATLNADNTGANASTGTLTSTTLTGLGMASGISYSNLSTLNVSLGAQGDTFLISGTKSGVTTTLNDGGGNDAINIQNTGGSTTINTGTGTDTIKIGSQSPSASGILTGIQGAVIITGNNSDKVTVDDTGTPSGYTNGQLTSTTVKGMSMGASGITYSGLAVLNVNLGSNNNQFTVISTKSGTTTTVTTDANDVINVQSTSGPTVIVTPDGANTVNVGSNAPGTGGNVNGIQGALTITGNGSDTLNVDDTGDGTANTGTLTGPSLNGLGMGASGIAYTGIQNFNINLGSGGNSFFVQGSSAGTTSINLGSGTNHVAIGSNAPATMGTLTDGNAPNTGSTLNASTGIINLTGSGNDSLNVDDTGNTSSRNGALYAARLTFYNSAPTSPYLDIRFQGFNALTISLGQGDDTFLVKDTFASTSANNQITINGDGGADNFAVYDTHALATLNGGDGNDNMYIFGNTYALQLNGNAGDDSFYIFASLQVSQNAATGIDVGTADGTSPTGSNAIYNYRQNGDVNVDGGTGDNKLFIYATVVDDVITIDGSNIHGAGLNVNYTNIQHLIIAGLQGNDTFYIKSTSIDTTLTGDATLPKFPPGIEVPDLTGGPAPVILNAPANGVLTSDITFQVGILDKIVSITITAKSTKNNTSAQDLVNEVLAAINATTLANDFSVYYDSLTNAIYAQILPSNSFNDTFYVGWQGANVPGSLAGIKAPLTIEGQDGHDVIYIDNSADTATESWTLTSTTFTGTGMGANGSITYDNSTEDVNINLGAGSDTVTVNGTGAGDQISIYGGAGNDHFIVNATDPATGTPSLNSNLAINGDSNTFAGDTLVVNGTGNGDTVVLTGFSIDGLGATINYLTVETLTINGIAGANTFTINGDSVPTTINGGPQNDTFTVNANTVPLTLDGGSGDDSFTINANSSPLTVTGDAGNDTFVVNGNGSNLTLSGGDNNDSFTINGNSGILTANGNNGDDTFVVNSISSPATLNGGAGNDSFTTNGPLASPLTVNGGTGTTDVLTVNGTTGDDYMIVSKTSVDGLGYSPVSYSNLTNVVVNGVAGNDTFLILSDSVITTINGSDGYDTFLVRTTNGPTYINTGGGINTVSIGSNVAYPGSVLSGIQGAVTVNGQGSSDTLLLDDSGSTSAKAYTLTNSVLTGPSIAPGGISYSDVEVLNFNLGSAGDTVNIQSTAAATTTTLNLGAGRNTVNIGSNAPLANGIVDGIQGPLTIIGAGSDLMNVDDTGSTTDKSGVLAPTTLNGLGMASTGIVFTGFSVLNISLGSGNDTMLVTQTFAGTTTINGNDGGDTFNVLATTGALTLNGNAGADIFNLGSLSPGTGGNLNSIAGLVTINGGSESDTINLDDRGDSANNTGTLTSSLLTGLGLGTGMNYSLIETLGINLGNGNNTFNVQSTAAITTTTLTTGSGTNTVNVGSKAPLTNGIIDNIQGGLVIVGSGLDTMNVDDTGSTTGKTGTLTGTTLTGLAMGSAGITYSGLAVLNISLGSGNDTVGVNQTSTANTTINGNNGADTFNVRATTGTLNLNGNAGNDTFNLGSLTPTTGGVLDNIAGQVNIDGGSGSNTVNADDTGDSTANIGYLTSTSLTGLGLGAGVNYASIQTLNINLGSGSDTFNVQSTAAITTTTLNTGSGSNTTNVGSNAPSNAGIVDNIQGALILVGNGGDILNVDDTGSTSAKTGTLTSSTLKGLGMGAAGITYSGLAFLNISLGSGGNTFTIASTFASTTTTLNSGSGADTINLLTTAGTTYLNGQGGNDTINIQSISAATSVNTGSGTNTINVGSLVPTTGGIINNIQAALTITGDGNDILNVDDTGSTGAKTGILTPTTLTGLGMSADGITYSGLAFLNISLGSGGNTFTITDTAAATTTTLNSGTGSDTVNLLADSGTTNVNAQAGDDTINVQSTGATTTVNTGTGTNTVNVGSLAPLTNGIVDGIKGALIIVANANDTLNVDDTGSTSGKTGTLTSSSITGLGMGDSGITYNNALGNLNINLGSGNDTFTIASTNSSTTTTLKSGIGSDTINVQSTAGSTTVNTGTGTNTVNVGSKAPVTFGIVDGIQGALTVIGSGTDTMNVDDTGSLGAKTGTLTSSTLKGLGMGASGITYSGLASLNISLGCGGNSFTIASTFASTTTTLNSGRGSDTINLLTTDALTYLNAQGGNDTINIQSIAAVTHVNTGSGTNTINVGSLAPLTNGILDNIQAALTITGDGNDTLNLDDTGSTGAKTGFLTATTITGLGMSVNGITYSGLAALNISLGSGGNTFTISTTSASTTTTLNSGSGDDTVNLLSDSGVTNVNGQDGDDTINVQTTGATTTIDSGDGANTVNVGSKAPLANGILDGIQGALNVINAGVDDTLNIDDTGSTSSKVGTLTDSTITGLGMGEDGISYTGELGTLNISLGSGGNTFTIASTSDCTLTTLNSGSGDDTINIQSTAFTTTVDTQDGTNTVNIGSKAPATAGNVNGIQGALTILGSGDDTLNVDDTGSTTDKTGTLTPTTLTGLGMGKSGITYSGIASLYINLGSGNDTFNINDINDSTVTTVDGGPGTDTAVMNFSSFNGTLTLLHFENGSLNVTNDFTGTLNFSGKLTNVSIGGSLTSTGTLHAGSIDTMHVGVDLAGLLQVDGLLGALTVDGGTPGEIIAGDIHTIAVTAGYGNKVLQVIEGGVERRIEATPVAGGTLSNTVSFTFFYDSTAPGDPQLAIRITRSGLTTSRITDPRFDLSLVTRQAKAKFNLARLDSVGDPGLRNISIEGDLLGAATNAELNFLNVPLVNPLKGYSQAGVFLLSYNIASIAVRDRLTLGEIWLKGIEGWAYGQLINSKGKVVNLGNNLGFMIGNFIDALIFAEDYDPVSIQAVDTFRVPVSENYPVKVFRMAMNYALTLKDIIADNQSFTAYIGWQQPVGSKPLTPSVVTTIDIKGDGASIDASTSVLGAITSTGPLGDITVRGSSGIAGITAPAILGNINATSGPITGTIQTTGVRIDQYTGATTTIAADLGKIILGKTGKIASVTTIHTAKGLNANLIVRGNLISSFKADASSTGNIAVQGDVGVIQTDAKGRAVLDSKGRLTRFGGITVGGTYSGSIVVLGNLLGNLKLGTFTGRIAVEGQAIAGLSASRFGILGNVSISSFAASSWVISGGMIGDAAGGTTFSSSSLKGILAAEGNISGKFALTALIYKNLLGTANGDTLAAVFTDGGDPLLFDITDLDLAGLNLILTDLGALSVDGTGTFSGPVQ